MEFMKKFLLVLMLVLATVSANAATAPNRANVRVGVVRPTMAANRMPTATGITGINTSNINNNTTTIVAGASAKTLPATTAESENCRDAYRDCMNDFCMMDESEGARCACSDNINQSKSLIKEIQDIQENADKIYTLDVEKENLDTRQRRLVFGESERAQNSSLVSGLSLVEWLNSGTGDSLGADDDIGSGLYGMAATYCESKLKSCGKSADMEEALYARAIVNDCKTFEQYLSAQKRDAERNVMVAEQAVRAARLKMLDTTNLYNRGECLLSYKSCISDRGGCGANFENCLDADLLSRRAFACEDVLDQCTAVRDYVLDDWRSESVMVLQNAAQYVDQNKRLTCRAKIRLCLEDGCSVSGTLGGDNNFSSSATCLTNVSVAAGICPIINECDALVPGLRADTNDMLGELRHQFCQNDIHKCLQDKCGANYTAPECLGKKTSEIVKLCPQDLFNSCNGEDQFDLIVQSALLDFNYQSLTGCTNYFAERLEATCGVDMGCLPDDVTITTLAALPATAAREKELNQTVRDNALAAVDEFFKQFEQDVTIAACKDSQKVPGRKSLRQSVFESAKLIAETNALKRASRQLDLKIAELTRTADIATAEKICNDRFAVEREPTDSKAYSYISSVNFEPALRNCHVCRTQRGFESGGESKATSGLKAAGGGLAAGAAAGTSIMPGWGTAIGGVVGAVGGFFAGRASGGIEEFPFEVVSCEDINL